MAEEHDVYAIIGKKSASSPRFLVLWMDGTMTDVKRDDLQGCGELLTAFEAANQPRCDSEDDDDRENLAEDARQHAGIVSATSQRLQAEARSARNRLYELAHARSGWHGLRAEVDGTVRSIELCSKGTPNMDQIMRDLNLGFKLDVAWGLEQLSGCSRVPAAARGSATAPTHLVVRFSTVLRQAVGLALVTDVVGNHTVLKKAFTPVKGLPQERRFARATSCAIHKIYTVAELRRQGHARQLVQALQRPAGFPGTRRVFAEAYYESAAKHGVADQAEQEEVSALWMKLGYRQCTGRYNKL